MPETVYWMLEPSSGRSVLQRYCPNQSVLRLMYSYILMTIGFSLHLKINSTESWAWSKRQWKMWGPSWTTWSVLWFMWEEECTWVITRELYWMRRPEYKVLRTESSKHSWSCLKLWCRRINWSWSAQIRNTSNGRLSFGQVIWLTAIVWPRQSSLPCRC